GVQANRKMVQDFEKCTKQLPKVNVSLPLIRKFTSTLCLMKCFLHSVALLTSCSSLAYAQSPANAQHPNIVLITIDTTRADRMGFLGSEHGLTPNLDALARQGVAFSRAYAQVPLTTPSHAVILTGTYPEFNHVNYMGDPLGTNLPFLPDIL